MAQSKAARAAGRRLPGAGWIAALFVLATVLLLNSPEMASAPATMAEAVDALHAGRIYQATPFLEAQAAMNNAEASFMLGTLNFGAYVEQAGMRHYFDGPKGSGAVYHRDPQAVLFQALDRSSPIYRCAYCGLVPHLETLVDLSRERGVFHLERAYQLGHAGAAAVLAEAYHRGMPGAPRNEALARTRYAFAASRGVPAAQVQLAGILLEEAVICSRDEAAGDPCHARIAPDFARAATLLEAVAGAPRGTEHAAALDMIVQLYAGEFGAAAANPAKLAFWSGRLHQDRAAMAGRAERLRMEAEEVHRGREIDAREQWKRGDPQAGPDFCTRHRDFTTCS